MSFSHTFATPVDPAFGFSIVRLKAEVPEFERPGQLSSFGYHAAKTDDRKSRVVATFTGGLQFSDDLGKSWKIHSLAKDRLAKKLGVEGSNLANAFITADQSILAQIKAPPTYATQANENPAMILRFSSDGKLLSTASPGHSHWHGTRSIDQSGKTILYAEYPNNKNRFTPNGLEDVDEEALDLRMPGVFRSVDDGETWEKVFEQSWRDIRHFHVVAADPYLPGTWWLSSGDKPDESRVWRSDDDGSTWRDVSLNQPKYDCYPGIESTTRSAYRFTDIWIGEDTLIWGSDDWLGGFANVYKPNVPLKNRAGSRIFMTKKSEQLELVDMGYVGNPVRSMIDVGPALVVMTEAKRSTFPKPQVFLVSKTQPGLVAEICTVDAHNPAGTGFVFSRASRVAEDGVFFTFRSKFDLLEAPARFARWTISFE